MKNVKLSKKTYITAFVFVMLLNICLGVFLIRNVLAQKTDATIKNQPPIVAEVSEQNDSPLKITIIDVDNSESLFQVINSVLQNTSKKPILAYTLVANSKSSGKVSTQYFGNKYFQPNEFVNYEIGIERQNLETNDKVSLSVDYVLFENGSSWGADTQKESERIAGNFQGKKKALKELTNLFIKEKTDFVNKITQKESTDFSSPILDPKQPSKWQTGFQQGYKSVISQLKFAYEKNGADGISLAFQEMKGFLKMEEEQ